MQRVQATEDMRKRGRDVLVDDELAGVWAVVESPVRHGEHTQLRERHRTTLVPERARELSPKRRGQRPH